MSRARRPCLDCGAVTHGTRCPTCQQASDHHRWASHKADRYNADHRALRRQWTPLVATGTVRCARADTDPRCPGLIAPDADWDLDHIDGTERPAHQRCNRAAH